MNWAMAWTGIAAGGAAGGSWGSRRHARELRVGGIAVLHRATADAVRGVGEGASLGNVRPRPPFSAAGTGRCPPGSGRENQGLRAQGAIPILYGAPVTLNLRLEIRGSRVDVCTTRGRVENRGAPTSRKTSPAKLWLSRTYTAARELLDGTHRAAASTMERRAKIEVPGRGTALHRARGREGGGAFELEQTLTAAAAPAVSYVTAATNEKRRRNYFELNVGEMAP